MIFLAKGHCYLGRRRIDKDGNVTEESPARFELDTDGGSVAVGVMDLDTMQITGRTEVFGDWDPWGYLGHALKLLAPSRSGIIPDFEHMLKKKYQDLGNTNCPMMYYCERPSCDDCIVQRWIEEVDEDEN